MLKNILISAIKMYIFMDLSEILLNYFF